MSYSTIYSHRPMVFDDVRNHLYAQAIAQLVTSDSVVLDVGAGMGILGLLAANKGAKRVYLVEPEPIVQLALEIARENGLQDRVVVLEDRIEDVELPEKVDLIVSALTGNLLYSEDLLPSLFHARDLYLKPGGHMLPDFAELMLAPVSSPGMHAKHIEHWSESNLGLDYSAGRRFAANYMLWPDRKELDAVGLAPGVVISAADLMTSSQSDCNGATRCRIETSGACHGLLGWIRIRLNDQWLSTDPSSPTVTWSPALLPLDPPLPLTAGEEISISLQRPARGDWTWKVEAVSGVRRHSSFLSRIEAPARLRRMAPDSRPGLDGHGEGLLLALAMMQERKSNREIAQTLTDSGPQDFQDIEEALRWVQALASRYGQRNVREQ